MSTKERIEYQTSIRELDTNCYKEKNVTKINNDRINKNRKIDKQDYNISD